MRKRAVVGMAAMVAAGVAGLSGPASASPRSDRTVAACASFSADMHQWVSVEWSLPNLRHRIAAIDTRGVSPEVRHGLAALSASMNHPTPVDAQPFWNDALAVNAACS